MEGKLKELYYLPLTGLTSATKLYKKVQDLGLKYKLVDIQSFVSKQLPDQLMYPQVKPKIYNSIESSAVKNNY